MIRIAITPESLDLDKEPAMVNAVLAAGWEMVHLRHPDATLADMRRLVEAIDPDARCRLRLHGHFPLIDEFNLGGLHLNRRCPEPPARHSGPLSRSCHSVDEVIAADSEGRWDYVTLSPVFDSISKQGYRAAFTDTELRRLDGVNLPVIALGGVTAKHLPALARYSFSGFAVLGALPWSGTADDMKDSLKMFNALCYNS